LQYFRFWQRKLSAVFLQPIQDRGTLDVTSRRLNTVREMTSRFTLCTPAIRHIHVKITDCRCSLWKLLSTSSQWVTCARHGIAVVWTVKCALVLALRLCIGRTTLRGRRGIALTLSWPRH
jgi:hypothetical protein